MRDDRDSSTPRSPTDEPSGAMYEVGTGRSLRALHVMPGMQGPEGSLHAHDYRIEVIVRRRDLVDGMVCDLDVLGGALADIVTEVGGRNLHALRPEGAAAMTVEVFARWLHDRLSATVRAAGGQHLAIRVWESDVAYGSYGAPVQGRTSSR